MRVEVWSDVVCPWCYIGKRRLEAALAQFPHRDSVEVVWRSFELDPRAPARREGSYAERLARKYGMTVEHARASIARLTRLADAEGLAFRLDGALPGNTFDAHRVLHLAAERGVQDAVKERFLAGYFTERRAIGEAATLVELAAGAGLDAGEVRAVLAGDRYAAEVRADEEAAIELAATGVPFFLVDGRFAIPGAQDTDVFLRVLDRAWAAAEPLVVVGDAGESVEAGCEDGSCSI